MRNFAAVLLTAISVAVLGAPLTAEARDAKQLTVGVVIPYEVGWFGAFKQGFDLVANQEGVKVVWQYHAYKADQETAAVQNLITLGVDAINVTAATADSAQYSCSLANEAGIPIQITESGISPGQGKPIANIDFNWEQIYRFAVEHIRAEVNGPLSMVYLSGIAGSPTVTLAIKGLKEEVAAVKDVTLATDVQYADYATDKAINITKGLVQSGAKFNVAVGVCQEVAEGIIQGLKEQNVARDKVTVVSINGGPMDVENFKKGELDFAVSQSPSLHGMICAQNLISYLKGKPYQTATYSPITWVSAKTWKKDLIPWDMDASWLPVVREFVKSGAYKPELRQ